MACDETHSKFYHWIKIQKTFIQLQKIYCDIWAFAQIPACHLTNAMILQIKENLNGKKSVSTKNKTHTHTKVSPHSDYFVSFILTSIRLRVHSYLDIKAARCRTTAIFFVASFSHLESVINLRLIHSRIS